ncbi:MAG TPA: hypothetical protein VN706_22850 [Gemmatimonadaceae bacterium]|nr:hypothetical protein [Gemmatimonadaceae bacterium]
MGSVLQLETIPLVLGVLVGLLGLGLIFDAWTPDEIIVKRERRRRPRAERSRGGETMIGLGVLAMAAAFAGRDTWRYSVVAVIAGTVMLLLGVIANRRYLAEAILHRGSLRRRPPTGAPQQRTPPDTV